MTKPHDANWKTIQASIWETCQLLLKCQLFPSGHHEPMVRCEEIKRSLFSNKIQTTAIDCVLWPFYLISLIYVIEPVSPTPIPSNAKPTMIADCDVAIGNRIHAITGTKFTTTMPHFRPIKSTTNPDNRFPIGWTINDTLAWKRNNNSKL